MTTANQNVLGKSEGAITSPPATCSAKVLHTGYIIELAGDGPWLREDGTWTPIWDERGVWWSEDDAKLAIIRSLSPNAADQTPPTKNL
jgi:hypothetical protein